MDFIERMFGVSPDGGDFSLESLYVLSITVAVVLTGYALYLWWKRKTLI